MGRKGKQLLRPLVASPPPKKTRKTMKTWEMTTSQTFRRKKMSLHQRRSSQHRKYESSFRQKELVVRILTREFSGRRIATSQYRRTAKALTPLSSIGPYGGGM